MVKPCTIIIAEHNEGAQLKDTLESLFDTSPRDLFDVIVVSDGSTIEPQLFGGATHLSHKTRRGVGSAFDTGVSVSSSPYTILMGSDIRFRDNAYLEKMLTHLEDKENEKALLCTVCLGLSDGNMDIGAKLKGRFGARILFFMTAQDLPPKGQRMAMLHDDEAVDNYRNILEAQWLSKIGEGVYDIPCILGAFYGVRTNWYEYIRGFKEHRYWGTLEPFISLKSWLAGGRCRVATDIETAHIFKKSGSHHTSPIDLVYNKIMASLVLFDAKTASRFIAFLGMNEELKVAHKMISSSGVYSERERFAEIQERDIFWFKEKFPFKDYNQL